MKTVVITGASRGIGRATAKKFLAERWRVVGTYRDNPIGMEENFIGVECDLSSSESIANATRKIIDWAPEIDLLVNNAGIILDAHDSAVDLLKVRKTFEVDLFGIIDFTEKLIPYLRDGARIINIDSTYGAFSFPIDDKSSAGYRLAKASLNMYTRILAFNHPDKVVSSLDPGWVRTDMGNAAATEIEGPDRDPQEAAEDIYRLATENEESGFFWRFGKKREW